MSFQFTVQTLPNLCNSYIPEDMAQAKSFHKLELRTHEVNYIECMHKGVHLNGKSKTLDGILLTIA